MTSTLNRKAEYFLFGSYLTQRTFNDIDVLVVVPDESDIELVQRDLNVLGSNHPNNILHFLIYTRSEYLNEENKFSQKKVSQEISFSELEKLMNLHLTSRST